ncbi:class II aldolase/adducin family protein [Alicyclobacillus dauci]|uniref:Class II aldolase/adducin family protein n=1 Tax=Alicyclobacillus dauci TaxID=1475485 RepID=A0ABY6Z7Q0_9BACL|nr:class II aldolase/adducin family protein [Alicyclobacillus dauci]WAH38852.1 class II aldolase/adducin family protein [Alicyclobacillus dauci]
MTHDSNDIRSELTKYSTKIVEKNLVAGPGGNISFRVNETVLISPSGASLDEITPSDWVAVDLHTGEILSGARPSSEVNLHLEIYRKRLDVNAIIHTHAIHCIAVSSAGRDIPPMFADFVAIVGDVSYLEYILPTTNDLAIAANQALGQRNAIVLRNHGAITVGSTLKEAYSRMEILEDAAEIYHLSLQMGTPRVLTDEECSDILNLESERYRMNLLKKPQS